MADKNINVSFADNQFMKQKCYNFHFDFENFQRVLTTFYGLQ
jgi:hypothetical protein